MKRTISDLLAHGNGMGKRLIIRCDFNVPLDDEGKITDNNRIVASLPTIEYAVAQGSKVILMSHLGRPKGKFDPKFSLAPVAAELEKLLGKKITFISSGEVVNDEIRNKAAALEDGEIMLLDNLRYREEEEANDEAFAKALASLADIYVNDAFGTAHRAHASTEGIAHFLPSCVGFLMEKEVKFLGDALENPKRPFVAILGGAKVSDKIRVIESLLEKVDALIIGGGMAYTFLKQKGYEIGGSLLDESAEELAGKIVKDAEKRGIDFLLPVDIKVAKEFKNDSESEIVSAERIPPDMQGLDIGPKTIKLFAEKIRGAGTALWNGPMGVFEMPNFAAGTLGVCEAMAESAGITIIGGGDSAAAAKELGFADKITHVSTGGGASLEFIERGDLVGLAVIAQSP